MRRALACLSFALLVACGSSDPPSPYDEVEVSETIGGGGLSQPVDMVRDQWGVPHIYAHTMADLAFAQGYVMASDRLPQMDLFRHFATGTIAELFGALEQEQIETDLEMRMHRMKYYAELSVAELEASSDPVDQAMLEYLQRFSDGVNHYLEQLRDGERELDFAVQVWFDASRTDEWTPADSLAIGRLQAWNLSYDDRPIRSTEEYQAALEAFDNASGGTEAAKRAGAYFDLFPMKPMDVTSTIDGFPPSAARAIGASAQRPHVPTELLRSALHTSRPKRLGLSDVTLEDARNGSNNWVVGPSLTDGRTIMSNDPHLQLSSPSIFYLNHLTVEGGIDVTGITFPGIPGVILGHNQHVAWGATTANHAVNDFYLETIVPCTVGGGDCAVYGSEEVPLETWEETIDIGALGTITDSKTVTYEVVPHHGPIIPDIVGPNIEPRTGGQAISVRYTGHQVTHELKALFRLWSAADVTEGMAAIDDFGFGAQNWVFADDQGNIGWTTSALLPRRTDGCFTFDIDTNPGGTGPWWVLPGDGSCEWDGFFARENVPRAMNPTKGYLATANGDPIGGNADGDVLNQPTVEDHLYYVGSYGYASGWRVGRITRRIEDLTAPITGDDMASIQADTYSNYGSALTPHIMAALAAYEEELATPGTHPDIEAWVAGLSDARKATLADAKAVLMPWTFETPAAVLGSPSDQEIKDSAATVLFNAWAVYFLRDAFGDEAARLGYGTSTWVATLGFDVFERPGELRTGLATETGEALLCDDMDTAARVESCTFIVLTALEKAMAWAAGPDGFGTADSTQWRWGQLHRLTLEALIPADELNVPPPNDPNQELRAGYPRHGDQYSVDASSPGYGSHEFSYDHGPAMRHITEIPAGGPPITRIALPGGEINDRDSGHFRDLMDNYWSVNAYFPLPWTTAEIIGASEDRWRIK